MTKEEQAHAQQQGFLCAQGDCLRNAFLITMGWQYAGYLPRRKQGYSLGMLASRIGQAYMELECIYANVNKSARLAMNALSAYHKAAFAEHSQGVNVVFCTGLNEAGEQHAWALIDNATSRGLCLVDAAKAGLMLVQDEDLLPIFMRTHQLAIVANNGYYMANSGANFMRILGNLPKINFSDIAG